MIPKRKRLSVPKRSFCGRQNKQCWQGFAGFFGFGPQDTFSVDSVQHAQSIWVVGGVEQILRMHKAVISSDRQDAGVPDQHFKNTCNVVCA